MSTAAMRRAAWQLGAQHACRPRHTFQARMHAARTQMACAMIKLILPLTHAGDGKLPLP